MGERERRSKHVGWRVRVGGCEDGSCPLKGSWEVEQWGGELGRDVMKPGRSLIRILSLRAGPREKAARETWLPLHHSRH